MNKFEQAPVYNLEKTCESKSNALVQAILGNDNEYKINTPHVESKLSKVVQEILGKHHLEETEENKQSIADLVMKKALEVLALDLGGNLRQKPDLENRYLEILKNEASDKSFYSHDEILESIKELDKQNILDNDKRGELFKCLIPDLKVETFNTENNSPIEK